MTTPLDATLVAEHAAVYVLASLGSATSESAQPDLSSTLRDAYTRHRTRRDELTARIRELGEDPPAAAPAYALPPLADPEQVRRSARRLEDACAQAYAAQVAATSGVDREWAVAALRDAALRVLDLGGDAEPFPGAPELG